MTMFKKLAGKALLSFLIFFCLGTASARAQVVINEVLSDGYPDWIELYNNGSISVNLAGVHITDGTTDYVFPAGTVIGPNGYLLLYASGTDPLLRVPGNVNLPFKLKKSGGETLTLKSAASITWDQYLTVDTSSYGDVTVSQARNPSGSGAMQISYYPTPWTQNGSIVPVTNDFIFNEVMGRNRTTLRSSIVDPLDGYNGFYDWIEIYNKNASARSLDNYRLDYGDDVWYFPAGITVPGHGYLVIFLSGKNQLITSPNTEPHTSFTVRALGNTGVRFQNPLGQTIDYVYIGDMGTDDPIGRLPDGTGNLINLSVATPRATNQNPPVNVSSIVVNEVATNESADWLELYNTSASAVNLAGSWLSDSLSTKNKWQFPPGLTIPGNGYMVVYCDNSNAIQYDTNGNVTRIGTNFAMKNDGTEPAVFSSSDLTYTNSITSPAMTAGRSYARIPNGTTGNVPPATAVLVTSTTPGSMNMNNTIAPDPHAADIVINEILADNDSNIRLNLGTYPGGDHKDWMELYNKGSATVNLNGMMIQKNTSAIWTLPNQNLGPGQYKLIFLSGLNLTGAEWHTNFMLSHNVSTNIKLLNTNSAVLQDITLPSTGHDVSYARYANGTGNFIKDTQPSPAAANINSMIANDSYAQNYIVINEIVSNNVNDVNLNLVTYPGTSKFDWIEIYNKGSQTFNLYELVLSDTKTWWFFDKNTMISPGQHLLVFADGDLNEDSLTLLNCNFAISKSGETIKLLNRDGITEINNVVVPALVDDQAYARIANGTGNFQTLAIPTPATANATVIPNPLASNIAINEIVSNNYNNLNLNLTTYPGGSQQDWIELQNKGTVNVELGGLKLTDTKTTWVLPNRTLNPGEYLVVFASSRDLKGTELHTNFSISSTQGETIQLLNKDNSIVESVSVPPLVADEAFSRIPNGTGALIINSQPTPGAMNIDSAVTPNPDAANITINEVVSDNANNVGLNLQTYPSGATQDWIELYNKGANTVNLAGLKLQDSKNNTWVFPSRTMNPGEYLIVFASGRDLKDSILHTNFQISSTNGETVRFLNRDNSVVETLTVPILGPDQAWARIANGTGAFKIVAQPTPLVINTDVPVVPNPLASNLVINEIVSDNVLNIGINIVTYPNENQKDWIELYNKGAVAVNLQGLKLANTTTAWILPSVTVNPGGYAVIFASGLSITSPDLHSNFTISKSQGDIIKLLNTDNAVVDSVTVGGLNADEAYARLPNGTGTFVETTGPTPGATNTNTPVSSNPLAANITINEIVSNNFSNIGLNLVTYPGGNQKDWIEFYNKGASSVDLAGLKLTDGMNNTWVFPSRVMAPGTYLIVFASGTSQTGPELHANFQISSSKGDTIKFLNKDNSVVETVNVQPLAADQASARIPNSTGAFVIVSQPTPLGTNSNTPVTANPNAGNITINEVLSFNVNNVGLNLTTYPGGSRADWIELYNKGAVAVDLAGLKLQDYSTVPGVGGDTWVFPAKILNPGEYLVVFADKKDLTGGEFHTNFSIDPAGATLRLLNKENTVIETFTVMILAQDRSAARTPNGTGVPSVSSTPTPGAVNAGGGPTIIYGDVNGDGNVTAIDASMTARYAVGSIPLTPEQVVKADVNNILGVTASDASWIARKAVGSITKFPIEP